MLLLIDAVVVSSPSIVVNAQETGQTDNSLASSSWLKVGAYMQYKQFFQWDDQNSTRLMTLNISRVWDNLTEARVTDYAYNITNGKVVLFPAESSWIVNMQTREIVKVLSGDNVTGYLEPFWISPDVSSGSVIDAYFGTHAQIQQTVPIQALGQPQNCWEATLQFGPVGTMQRWYEQSTGIVLLIVTSLTRGDISMHVTETAIGSNIQMPVANGGTYNTFLPYLGGAALGAGLIIGSLMYLRRRRSKPPTASSSSEFRLCFVTIDSKRLIALASSRCLFQK
jgi:hypothetical protein